MPVFSTYFKVNGTVEEDSDSQEKKN